MHTPVTEHRRSSHLTRVAVLDLGPGGQYCHQLHAVGGKLVEQPRPAPDAPSVVHPKLAAATARRPWRWSHFFFGFFLAFVLAALGDLLILAILTNN